MRWNGFHGLGAIGAAYLIAYGVSFINWGETGRPYRARWIYANSSIPIVTNEIGAVVQPRAEEPRMGLYKSPKYHPSDELKIVLSPNKRGVLAKKVIERPGCWQATVDDVMNAFKSIEYVISDDPIPIISVEVVAKSPAVSLGVLSVIRGEISQRAESEEMRVRRILRIGPDHPLNVFRIKTLCEPKLIP